MEEGECSTNLGLAIGGGGKEYKPSVKFHVLFPRHSLIMKEEEDNDKEAEQSSKVNVSIFRSRNLDEEEAVTGGNNTRKKLKLTEEQIMLLEDNFREHKTLNTVSNSLTSQLILFILTCLIPNLLSMYTIIYIPYEINLYCLPRKSMTRMISSVVPEATSS